MGRRAGVNFEKAVFELFLQGHCLRPVDIERLLGASHPHVMKVLRKFRERGWIRKVGNRYSLAFEALPASRKSDDPRRLLLYYFWLFQQRLKILRSMRIEWKDPYLRIPLPTYLKAHPEENVYAKFIEKSLEEVSRDERLLKVLMEEGMLRVVEREEVDPHLGPIIIEERYYKEAENERDYGLFYKQVIPPQKVKITEDDVNRLVMDFLVRVGEIARLEAKKLLRFSPSS
ncbi:MAG: hypothetical protein NZ938_00365 [Aigarchaeota archaeon]|nr:hypothetical protein [Candidatus Calditenuaceae archaeon]